MKVWDDKERRIVDRPDIDKFVGDSQLVHASEMISGKEGIKESEGKLFYEIDWSFIEKMAQRMALNKGKYEPFNWKKGINIEVLNQAITRHFIEINKGNPSDEQLHGHYIALACNAMMAVYQLDHNKKVL